MPDTPGVVIPVEDRMLATMTHLSGLSGYVIPFGGVLVPIIIWMVKKDSSPLISAIARQAILLNVVAFALIIVGIVLLITIILIPVVILGWCLLAIGAVALPIIGAIKANSGVFYRYPIVGANP